VLIIFGDFEDVLAGGAVYLDGVADVSESLSAEAGRGRGRVLPTSIEAVAKNYAGRQVLVDRLSGGQLAEDNS